MKTKAEATRQKIFEVSLRLFTQKGYGSTTIRDIAAVAGISPGLVLYHFPNKQSLLTGHLELAAQGMGAVLGLLESKQPALQTFSSIAKLTLGGMREPAPRLLYLLMNQPLPMDMVPKHLQEMIKKDRIISASIQLIKKGQKEGEIKPGDPHALAIVFWGAIQGTAEVLTQQPDAPIPEPDWLVGILKA